MLIGGGTVLEHSQETLESTIIQNYIVWDEHRPLSKQSEESFRNDFQKVGRCCFRSDCMLRCSVDFY